MPCETPIIFLIFCRPDLTSQVFETIRQVQPKKLLVVADGPRNESEASLCQQARAVTEAVEWDCEVLRNYADKNLGCRQRVSSGLDWAFTQVEEAIILEDDCLPDISFFHFCEELLEHYRYDQRVMMISGDNFCLGKKRTDYSYYFSRYINIWGWATWKRAWQHYDIEMYLWDEIKQGNWLQNIFSAPRTVDYWHDIFQRVYDGDINTWDYQWVFACWIQSGYSVVPTNNLVSNIGFGIEATHTTRKQSKSSAIPTESIQFPLVHPPFVIQDAIVDRFLQREFFDLRFLPWLRRQLKRSYKQLLHKIQLFSKS